MVFEVDNDAIVFSDLSLQEQFQTLRSKMVALGMKLGLNHPAVLEISRELDEIHNKILKVGKRR